MSAYKVIECEISEDNALIAAIVDMGMSLKDILIYETPQSLRGYRDDVRAQKAHVVITKEQMLKTFRRSASNDVGFEKVNGKYIAHVSNYDMPWWKTKEPRFKQVAAAEQVTAAAKRRGYYVKRIEEGGKIRLKLIKNF